MTTFEVGKKLVELCKQGKNEEAMQALYAQDIASVEAGAPPGGTPETTGLEAVIAKGKQWSATHEVHSASVEGPFPHGDRFIVRFKYDVTDKTSNQRMSLDEGALYTVKDGKIVREEFFYAMGA
jgi:ketosteroid isomerase-like protein